MMIRLSRSSNRGHPKCKAVRNSVLPRCVVQWSHSVTRQSVQGLSNARIMNRINSSRYHPRKQHPLSQVHSSEIFLPLCRAYSLHDVVIIRITL